MDTATWANTVLITIAAITSGLLGWAVVQILKLLWRSRSPKLRGIHHDSVRHLP